MALFTAAVVLLAACAAGHSDAIPDEGSSRDYAANHMATEHHIAHFDAASFFQIHDLNRNGYWESDEIEAVYGMHHAYAQRKSQGEEDHSRKSKLVVETVLAKIDRDRDGRISLLELEAAGLHALPSFEHLGAEGHHYDVESEFFLHHEETHHSTPETQTDESYVHPEDIEHFAQHEEIEAEEDRRLRKFQGISDQGDEPLSPDVADPDSQGDSQPNHTGSHVEGQVNLNTESISSYQGESEPRPAKRPQVVRGGKPENQDPSERFAQAVKDGQERPAWGEGDQGYKRPKTPADRMRRNTPYKYKFRRNWGDF